MTITIIIINKYINNNNYNNNNNTHTHTHTYLHTHTHTLNIHNIYTYVCMYTCTHTQTHTHKHIYIMVINGRRKEGNILFNDTLNTFYLWLYGIGHMVKNHLDSERGNPLQPHGLLFPISSKGSFICTMSQTG